MKKRKWSIMLLLTVLLTLFCRQPVMAAGGAENSTSEDGITVTITTDQSSYKAGEEIHYTMTVTNEKTNWQLNAVKFSYSNSDGIIPAAEDSMPNELPVIKAGESYELTGTLTGDAAVYPATGSSTSTTYFIIGSIALGVVVILLIVGIVFGRRKKGQNSPAAENQAEKQTAKQKKNGRTGLLIFLTAAMCMQAVPVKAAEFETITLRPYVQVEYAGQTVNIRAVIDFQVLQESISIASENVDNAKKITCHDPSIFEDTDGRYYVFGSFLASAYSDDLYDWTSIDGEFQATFTEEAKEQIGAWNDDNSAGSWNGYLWAPDVIYNTSMNKYCMYLSANGDNWKSNLVLLTADAVTGPYDYAGTVIYGGFNADDYAMTDAPLVTGETELPERYVTNGVDNRKWGDMYPNCIDPCVFYDDDGKLWMSYGSWSGGIFMLALDEETGLRDYGVSYDTDLHSDAYFGKKIAGGAYVSGEASYIQKIGDYYWLFISYGNLEAAGGYNIRVFRSETPDGDYVDEQGNSAFYDTYSFNYNTSRGVRLFGGYKWRTFTFGQVAQGHNSAFVDSKDGKAYIVFHTRTSNGTEGHYVKIHQLFLNKEGWLVTAPYQTSGETLKESGYSASEVAGDYEMIIHDLDIDYANLETKRPVAVTLTEDGKITGEYEGTWSVEPGTSYITLSFDGENYSGVTLQMKVENTTIETMVFTALGTENQVTIWGSKVF